MKKKSSIDSEVIDAHGELARLLGARYTVDEFLGKGGAGIVFKITDATTGVNRVAKLLRADARKLKDIKIEFEREAKRLAALRHSNLITVYEQSRKGVTPYFIMEHIQGRTFDKTFREFVLARRDGIWVNEVLNIALQLSDVLNYLHSQHPPLLHLDIKPENIILSRNFDDSPLPILLDFGISREADAAMAPGETGVRGTFPMWPNKYVSTLKRLTTPERTLFRIDRSLIREELDLHLLGRTLHMLIQTGELIDPISPKWKFSAKSALDFLRHIIERLDIDVVGSVPFKSAADLRETIQRIEPRLSRTRGHFGTGLVKIPGTNVRSFGIPARTLTDWPRFQRLRGILQLGVTYLVYPGAVHTRHEHSLGVFENSLRALDQITGESGDFRFRSVVSDEELIATAVVALLHDVGHYPFAHQFRLRGKFPIHEERTLDVMEKSDFKKLIINQFNGDVYQAILDIMKFVIAHEDTRPGAVSGPSHYRVLRDIVSGSFDVDKLDYVKRDAWHSGVPYGRIVDQDRFFTSLQVWWKDGEPELLLSDKGRVCAEALVFSRYLMTSEVYWNHAVRSYAAMLTAALNQYQDKEVRVHLWDTDHQFLSWIVNDPRSSWLGELINQRKPFRRAFVHQRLGGGQTDDKNIDKNLFDILEEAASGSDKAALESIKRVVRDVLKISGDRDYEIVLDIPEGMTSLAGVKVLAEGHDEPGSAGPIFEGIGQNFDGFARKARIFVHPRLLGDRSVADSTAAVRERLIQDFNLK